MFLNQLENEALAHLPRELVDFARRQFVNATLYKGDERRREYRHPMVLPVRAVAVDFDAKPIGEPFDVITRDVSSTSIGVIHTNLVQSEYLAIRLPMAGIEVNLMIELLWSGAMGPFYGAAGRYLRRLSEFPAP